MLVTNVVISFTLMQGFLINFQKNQSLSVRKSQFNMELFGKVFS